MKASTARQQLRHTESAPYWPPDDHGNCDRTPSGAGHRRHACMAEHKDAPIQNKFLPTKVTCEVMETFNGSTGVKSNVNVKNTGTIDAFIRVKLVTYRTNDQGSTLVAPHPSPPLRWAQAG